MSEHDHSGHSHSGSTKLLIVSLVFTSAYAGVEVAGGLWAVVVTDLVQLVLALVGALAVALAALHAAGGMTSLLDQLQALDRPEVLSLFPWTLEGGRIQWLEGAGISVPMFLAYVALQWWSFRRSDGGGEFIQRMLATRDEQQARLAGWVFLVVNYLVRSWLWVVVALAAQMFLIEQIWQNSRVAKLGGQEHWNFQRTATIRRNPIVLRQFR